MDTKRIIIDGCLVLAILALSGLAWSQRQRLVELDEQVDQLQAQVEHPPTPVAVDASGDEAPRRVARRRARPRPKPGTPDPPTIERFTTDDSPRDDAPVERFALDDPTVIDEPEVRLKLRDVIQEEQAYLREQRRAKRQENREKRVRERVQKFAEAQELDETATMQVGDRLAVELAEMTELFRTAREDGTWREAREKIGAIREETDQEIERLLEPEQYEAYQEMRAEDFRGPRRRGPRGSRGRQESNDGRTER